MWDHCSHIGGKRQHKHWLVFAVDARVIRFSWILLLNVVTMVNLFGVRMLPLLTDPKNVSILHKHHIFCVYQRLILFSLLATFPLIFLLICLVFTLTLHQLINVNTGFGTLCWSMCVCLICLTTAEQVSADVPFLHHQSRMLIAFHALYLQNSTFSHLHKLIKHQTSPADPRI